MAVPGPDPMKRACWSPFSTEPTVGTYALRTSECDAVRLSLGHGEAVVLGLGPEVALVLVVVGFLGGIGIATIGPGGIFVTVALYVFTTLTSAEVAGTAHATHLAAGLAGTVAYRRSGELLTGAGRRLGIVLSVTSVFGAVLGAHLNTYVDDRTFGVLLGVVTAVTGIILIRRHGASVADPAGPGADTQVNVPVLVILGLSLGTVAGLMGVGGPVFAVPALVLLNVPMLLALGVAQVQSIVISGFAAAGYAFNQAVIASLVLLVGVPQVLGVIVGWRIAHLIDPDRLTYVLGAVLVLVGLYLILRLPS